MRVCRPSRSGARGLNVRSIVYESAFDSGVLPIATVAFMIAGESFAGLIRFTLDRGSYAWYLVGKAPNSKKAMFTRKGARDEAIRVKHSQ